MWGQTDSNWRCFTQQQRRLQKISSGKQLQGCFVIATQKSSTTRIHELTIVASMEWVNQTNFDTTNRGCEQEHQVAIKSLSCFPRLLCQLPLKAYHFYFVWCYDVNDCKKCCISTLCSWLQSPKWRVTLGVSCRNVVPTQGGFHHWIDFCKMLWASDIPLYKHILFICLVSS